MPTGKGWLMCFFLGELGGTWGNLGFYQPLEKIGDLKRGNGMEWPIVTGQSLVNGQGDFSFSCILQTYVMFFS